MTLKYILPLLFLYLVDASGNSQCSNFDFQEKLLEKMIKVEFEVGQMLKESKDVVSTVRQELAALKNERVGWEAQLTTYEERQKGALDNMEQRIKVQSVSIEETKNITASLTQESSTAPLIAFHARQPGDYSLENNDVIIYQTFLHNYGNGYNTATGIFTVPERGLYLFSVHVCPTSGQYFYFAIVKDGSKELLRSQGYENSGNYCSSTTISAFLEVGERVWVKSTSTNSNNVMSGSWNSFSGLLIHK